jgi:hypothetical protein
LQRGGKNQVTARDSRQHSAEIDVDVRWRPKAIAPDGAMPGDVPVHPRHGAGHRRYGTPDVPGHCNRYSARGN